MIIAVHGFSQTFFDATEETALNISFKLYVKGTPDYSNDPEENIHIIGDLSVNGTADTGMKPL